MRYSILKHLALSLLLVGTLGCSDFLEETNPNEMSTDSFWKTLDDADTGLIAVYNAFKNNNVLSTADEYNRSDMTWPGWGRPNTSNEYYLHTFNSGSGVPNNKWDALYKGIFRANQVIEGVDKLIGTFSDPAKTKRATVIKAQAHFFRGLFYHYLHSSFNNGSVPIFDFVPQNESDFYQPLQDAKKVQDFFRTDLEYAYSNLPAKWTERKDLGRVTAGAAASVLGTSYLYEKDYPKAATYFKDVIENPLYGYALTPSIGDNFTTRRELNEESILEINYSLAFKAELNPYAEENVSSTLNYTFSPVGGFRAVLPSLWLINAYKNEVMDKNDPRNFVTDKDGTRRMRSYSLRTSHSIALPDDLDQTYYLKTSAQGAAYNNAETAYYRKYTNWDIVSNEKDILPNLRSGINVRVIRLADVYLMYAETLIKGGTDAAGVQEAQKYINRVRHRSALQLLGTSANSEFASADHDGKAYTATSLMQHLMYVERPLELSVEGHAIRFLDMRRWGITKQRFQDLSKQKYYGENLPFVGVDGKPATRWGSVLTPGTKATYKEMVDYTQAAQNYTESAHAYWPIPSSELISNPVIK
ncbi:RagB/SusD family nutrient uptake outer membrane protein [Persicitalea jodogahamensis]|uniref:Membrane protein n=1 Tax=Persicitalea jodogahamensis TaxID=402147 RepID=A0A8J3G9I1_9BACT|nr:RagB/SusD family nutrient uptake outer membrane protein [Persicitalea jodogahamensis]GHB63736.1 membrane protein [Persicitalea jodogahamensis]